MNKPLITFDQRSSQRIARAVQTVEGQKHVAGSQWYPYRGDGGAAIVIGKTPAAWPKGTQINVNVYGGNPPNLVNTGTTLLAMNLFSDIEADKWVAISSGYLISAEC